MWQELQTSTKILGHFRTNSEVELSIPQINKITRIEFE